MKKTQKQSCKIQDIYKWDISVCEIPVWDIPVWDIPVCMFSKKFLCYSETCLNQTLGPIFVFRINRCSVYRG